MENWLRTASSVFLLCAATGIASQAQTLKTLLSFDDTNGAFPYLMSVVQGLDGNVYGTTEEGGSNSQNAGSVFKITPAGTLTTLHSFCSERNASGYCSDGAYPQAGLLLIAGGNFYGTTSEGGASNAGTIFEITPAGKLTTIYNFCSRTACEDGDYPTAALILGSDGNYYVPLSMAGPVAVAVATAAERPSGSLRAECSPPFTAFARAHALTEATRWPGWCRARTETFTERPLTAGPKATARSSR